MTDPSKAGRMEHRAAISNAPLSAVMNPFPVHSDSSDLCNPRFQSTPYITLSWSSLAAVVSHPAGSGNVKLAQPGSLRQECLGMSQLQHILLSQSSNNKPRTLIRASLASKPLNTTAQELVVPHAGNFGTGCSPSVAKENDFKLFKLRGFFPNN